MLQIPSTTFTQKRTPHHFLSGTLTPELQVIWPIIKNFLSQHGQSKTERITIANGKYMASERIPFINFVPDNHQNRKIPIKVVLYAPTLESKLHSVKGFTKQEYLMTFRGCSCIITKGSHKLAKRKITDELYSPEVQWSGYRCQRGKTF